MKLALSDAERVALRRGAVKLSALARTDPDDLAARTGLPDGRCRWMVAMAQFQTLESVGPAAAQDLWDLGCASLSELAPKDAHELYLALTLRAGVRMDPCVEDVFRCAIEQARDPALPAERRQWWYWTGHRGRATRRL
jgi:hypothetical protein